MVYIYTEPFSSVDESDHNYHVTSDNEGRFTVNTSGPLRVVAVWKPGYAIAHTEFNSDNAFPSQVTIRKLQSSNFVRRTSEFAAANGKCISVASGKTVSPESPDADFVIERDTTQPPKYYIRALRKGGVVPIGQEHASYGDSLLYNSPEAPLNGYLDRALIERPDWYLANIYYIRTADGAHYGKVLVYPGVGVPGADFEGCRFECLFQPDGTRNLEVLADDSMQFDVHAFGIELPHNPRNEHIPATDSSSQGRSN